MDGPGPIDSSRTFRSNNIKSSLLVVSIATVLNYIITVIFVNLFGAIISGIYIGYFGRNNKNVLPPFYVLSVIIYWITSKPSHYEDPAKSIFVNLLSFLLTGLFPIAFALFTRFVLNKINNSSHKK